MPPLPLDSTALRTESSASSPPAQGIRRAWFACLAALSFVLASGCASWTTGVECGDCGTCRPGPLRILVHHLHCYRPLPPWAGYGQSEEPEIPPEELIPVRGRFHAVPTRPVFAPKPRAAAPLTGEPTPARAPLPAPADSPEPAAAPLQPPIPMQAPQPEIPMEAPAQGRTAAAGAEGAPAGAAPARSASRVGGAAEASPALSPPSHIATRPVEDPWRRRGGPSSTREFP